MGKLLGKSQQLDSSLLLLHWTHLRRREGRSCKVSFSTSHKQFENTHKNKKKQKNQIDLFLLVKRNVKEKMTHKKKEKKTHVTK